jgi:hypothetical protein
MMPAMPTDGFDALRERVLADPAAQARLRAAMGWDAFVRTAGALAAEHGIALAPGALDAARAAARRAWIERGI